MYVLMINGSPKPNGCIGTALKIIGEELAKENIESEIVTVGNKDIRGCIACTKCHETGKCVFNDLVNETAPKLERADALILGTPVYFASANGTLVSFADRLFYSTHFSKNMKLGASVVSCRRGGNSATFDEVNKYFTISGMPVVSSTYWNDVHGYTGEDVYKDEEGVQTMKNLAHNMAFLLKSVALGKEQFGLPAIKKEVYTNMIR